MADRTAIEWTDATWNPLRGCSRVSVGCRNCYAEIMAARFSKPGQWGHGLANMVRVHHTGQIDHRWTGKVILVKDQLDQPLRWKKPRRIFVNSTSDLFHEAVPDEWIDQVFAVMALAPQHTFQVLTKRPERMRAYLAASRSSVICREAFDLVCEDYIANPKSRLGDQCIMTGDIPHLRDWPLPNVWLGTSIEDQATADTRIPHLLSTPAAVRFISAEPLLGPVTLVDRDPIKLVTGKDAAPESRFYVSMLRGWGKDPYALPGLDWVICGGESGPGALPMHPDWARSLRDQCQAAGVAFFFKQWGEWAPVKTTGHDDPRYPPSPPPTERLERLGKKAAGRLLDGRDWNQMPGVRDA